MAILEAIEDLIALPGAGVVTGVDSRLCTVEGFDRCDEVAGGQAAAAEFADGLLAELGFLPGAVRVSVEPDAFLRAGQDLLADMSLPAHGVEIVRDVAGVVDELGLPFVLRVSRLAVSKQLGTRTDPGFIADAVKRLDDEVPAAGRDFDPRHAMDGRFVVQLHRLPLLGAVGGRDEIKDRATLHRVGRIPARADGDLGLTVAIEILCRDAHVIFLREVRGDDVLLPCRVLIPLHRGLVG